MLTVENFAMNLLHCGSEDNPWEHPLNQRIQWKLCKSDKQERMISVWNKVEYFSPCVSIVLRCAVISKIKRITYAVSVGKSALMKMFFKKCRVIVSPFFGVGKLCLEIAQLIAAWMGTFWIREKFSQCLITLLIECFHTSTTAIQSRFSHSAELYNISILIIEFIPANLQKRIDSRLSVSRINMSILTLHWNQSRPRINFQFMTKHIANGKIHNSLPEPSLLQHKGWNTLFFRFKRWMLLLNV